MSSEDFKKMKEKLAAITNKKSEKWKTTELNKKMELKRQDIMTYFGILYNFLIFLIKKMNLFYFFSKKRFSSFDYRVSFKRKAKK